MKPVLPFIVLLAASALPASAAVLITPTGLTNNSGVSEFSVEFSTDGGGSYSTSTTVSQTLSDYAIGNAVTLPFGGSFQADTVRINITDNHFGGTAPAGDRIGVGEFKFIGTVVPEPGFSALALISAFLLQRRRRS